jgi:16S rRNA processing protein RimM
VLQVTQARAHGDTVVAQVADCADRTQAEALRGARIFVSRASFPRTGDDEYYWVDLIGADVINREHQLLGTVTGLIDTGGNDVLCVQPPAAGPTAREGEHLIPFVSAYVDAVDVAKRRIVVDWGLDY